ncbi:hypothetical protein ACSLGF_03315 [Bacillus sp. A015]
MIKAKKNCLFSLVSLAVTMASFIVGRGSLIAANFGVSKGNAGILAELKKQGKAKAAAC